jgi:hypothetical protein
VSKAPEDEERDLDDRDQVRASSMAAVGAPFVID